MPVSFIESITSYLAHLITAIRTSDRTRQHIRSFRRRTRRIPMGNSQAVPNGHRISQVPHSVHHS
jgi:hypothetical protein